MITNLHQCAYFDIMIFWISYDLYFLKMYTSIFSKQLYYLTCWYLVFLQILIEQPGSLLCSLPSRPHFQLDVQQEAAECRATTTARCSLKSGFVAPNAGLRIPGSLRMKWSVRSPDFRSIVGNLIFETFSSDESFSPFRRPYLSSGSLASICGGRHLLGRKNRSEGPFRHPIMRDAPFCSANGFERDRCVGHRSPEFAMLAFTFREP